MAAQRRDVDEFIDFVQARSGALFRVAFLLVGGLLSMFIRLQLAWFGAEVLSADRYNQFVTLHGTTMMFLFAVPILEGMAIYLLPKMLGARDLPFPRLGAFG